MAGLSREGAQLRGGSNNRISPQVGCGRDARGPRETIASRRSELLDQLYMQVHVNAMGYISIRDLQKLSGEKIRRLAGPTAVKSGERTVALLFPLKKPDPKRLSAALKRAREAAKKRDRASDDAALTAMGIDPTDYSDETVRAIQKDWRGRR